MIFTEQYYTVILYLIVSSDSFVLLNSSDPIASDDYHLQQTLSKTKNPEGRERLGGGPISL